VALKGQPWLTRLWPRGRGAPCTTAIDATISTCESLRAIRRATRHKHQQDDGEDAFHCIKSEGSKSECQKPSDMPGEKPPLPFEFEFIDGAKPLGFESLDDEEDVEVGSSEYFLGFSVLM